MKILGESWGFDYYMQPLILLRGTILNRTYGLHQNQHIFGYFYSQYLVLFTMVPRNININSYNVHTAVSVLGFFCWTMFLQCVLHARRTDFSGVGYYGGPQ